MLSVVKMPLKREAGGHALNSHGDYIVYHGKPWKNHGIAIILMGKRELVALLNLSSWCLVMVERLFLAVPQGCLRFVIVGFPDHTHLLLLCF